MRTAIEKKVSFLGEEVANHQKNVEAPEPVGERAKKSIAILRDNIATLWAIHRNAGVRTFSLSLEEIEYLGF